MIDVRSLGQMFPTGQVWLRHDEKKKRFVLSLWTNRAKAHLIVLAGAHERRAPRQEWQHEAVVLSEDLGKATWSVTKGLSMLVCVGD